MGFPTTLCSTIATGFPTARDALPPRGSRPPMRFTPSKRFTPT